MDPIQPLIEALNLKPTGRHRVAMVLAQMHDLEGGYMQASMLEIASCAELSKAQARKHVHALTDEGVLRVLANAHGGTPGEAPRYEFVRERISQLLASVPDLFRESPLLTGPTHHFVSEGRARMVAELVGRPGQRCVQFYREAEEGLRDYGSVSLADLLKPWRLDGQWDAVTHPLVDLEDDYSEEIFPGEFEKLQQWAQAAALGRMESVVEV
ncbi:hypothetical protein [Ottowia thiooxydans]|uniref:hypothetical protein n=1 Tax=Ottowia thiooxydans TaxID=219182 RepID=UPI00041944E7|nr:hypothetical protein [Ottowia thiooxydans]